MLHSSTNLTHGFVLLTRSVAPYSTRRSRTHSRSCSPAGRPRRTSSFCRRTRSASRAASPPSGPFRSSSARSTTTGEPKLRPTGHQPVTNRHQPSPTGASGVSGHSTSPGPLFALFAGPSHWAGWTAMASSRSGSMSSPRSSGRASTGSSPSSAAGWSLPRDIHDREAH